MLGWLLLGKASALTLDEAVQRAAEVDPDALIAALEADRARLDVTGAVGSLVGTPSASAQSTWSGGAATRSSTLSWSVPLVDVSAWFNALSQGAQAREARWWSDSATLDAQYAAAAMYHDVLAAQAREAAAEQGLVSARATAEAVAARVSAGLESELVGRSARLGVLDAEAAVAQARSGREIALARLSRALEEEVSAVEEPTGELEVPADVSGSPALQAESEALADTRWKRGERVAQLFPTGDLSVSTGFLPVSGVAPFTEWSVTFGGTWTFDGFVGPVVRLRQASIDARVEEIRADALKRDLELALVEARSRSVAADRVAEAAVARQQLAEESLQIGQARLAAGLAGSLEVLRLQDEAAGARTARVEADLERALARLEARRVAGVRW